MSLFSCVHLAAWVTKFGILLKYRYLRFIPAQRLKIYIMEHTTNSLFLTDDQVVVQYSKLDTVALLNFDCLLWHDMGREADIFYYKYKTYLEYPSTNFTKKYLRRHFFENSKIHLFSSKNVESQENHNINSSLINCPLTVGEQ